MLGDVYLATALAIFLAIFGWSENIFGLSRETKEKEADFLNKTGLSREKYNELRKLISKADILDPGDYLKKVMILLNGTKLMKGGKKIFDKINQNEKKLIEWEEYNKIKKIFFVVLFIFLFTAGTIILIIENGKISNILNVNFNGFFTYSNLVAIFQIILFTIIVFGFFLYKKLSDCETYVQNKLNEMIEERGL